MQEAGLAKSTEVVPQQARSEKRRQSRSGAVCASGWEAFPSALLCLPSLIVAHKRASCALLTCFSPRMPSLCKRVLAAVLGLCVLASAGVAQGESA